MFSRCPIVPGSYIAENAAFAFRHSSEWPLPSRYNLRCPDRVDQGLTVKEMRKTPRIAQRAITNPLAFRGMRIQGRQLDAPDEEPFSYVQAAAATRGTVMENGLWCSKARSRWPTIVYFGLWVGGRKPAISLRKWW